ncbi:MAG: AAA family ATPase [Planctomycetes bacterium]|nr:AAA family ATPase [Planctomycetota bacterium]
MSADQAFDNLMRRNALAIPVARPAGETDRPPPAPSDEGSGSEQAGRGELAARVAPDGLPGRRQADSHPAVPAAEDPARLSDHPTVTDCDPVAEAEPDTGRLAETDGFDPVRANREFEPGEIEHGLDLARRVRRFAYIPLAGMDVFERQARELMAALVSRHPERPSLAVTSARRGEGRTELSIRLALAMARRVGYRVLLCDCDVGRPDLARRLGVSSKYFTLSDVLRGACPVGEALVVSEEDNLYLLPARPPDRPGDEVLDGRQAAELLEQMHDSFDFVVLDCGPVDDAAATTICALAGSAAIAGYGGWSSARSMAAAGAGLEAAGATVAGVVLTGTYP